MEATLLAVALTMSKMTGETLEVRYDKRKPRTQLILVANATNGVSVTFSN